MKYTVSGSTLQYKVGLTLSFLSLISRGVGGIQKGNTSISVKTQISFNTIYYILTVYTVLYSITVLYTVYILYREVRYFLFGFHQADLDTGKWGGPSSP